jgi:hypothetical protein
LRFAFDFSQGPSERSIAALFALRYGTKRVASFCPPRGVGAVPSPRVVVAGISPGSLIANLSLPGNGNALLASQRASGQYFGQDLELRRSVAG